MKDALKIVDFSHLFSRNIFVSINQANPSKKNGKFITEEIAPYFKHLIFNSLQYIDNKFKGEMLLALDAKHNWRKDFYKDYKGTRAKGKEEGDLNWEEVYIMIEEIVEVIESNFPYMVLKVKKAEADDIGGALSTLLGNTREVILVTSDHDWLQNITHGKYVKMFDPMKKEFVDLTDWEHEIIDTIQGPMSRFTIMHSLQGDSGDNVPKVTFETEFSPNFISYLKENEIYSNDVEEVKSMSMYDDLVAKYQVFNKIKSGKRKGEIKLDYRIWYRLSNGDLIKKNDYIEEGLDDDFQIEEVPEKDIFKSVNFGDKKARFAAESSENLKETLEDHKLYKKNFIFSNILVDFNKMPEELKQEIMDEFNKLENSYNPKGIIDYFMDEGLGMHLNQLTKFHSNISEVKSSLDDFF